MIVSTLFSTFVKTLICERGAIKGQQWRHISEDQCVWNALSFRSGIRTQLHEPRKKEICVPLVQKAAFSKAKCDVRLGFQKYSLLSSGLLLSLPVCSSDSVTTHDENVNPLVGGKHDPSSGTFSHGKKVHFNYVIIGIHGDGSCLFRSVAHGACVRAGKPAPNENVQKRMADELRAKVADELLKRRDETEWFIEGDFDAYVSRIRQTHVWGGEPELLMASHVLQMPVTVYMYDDEARGLISIAEYGLEYGRENPIRVLYHGVGHYDALETFGDTEGG